jgi:hypothetical protein
MSPDPRVGALLGVPVHDGSGTLLGRVTDLETDRAADGRERIVAVLVTHRPWGRLLGYERDQLNGPWLLEWLAARILRREMRRVPWPQARASLEKVLSAGVGGPDG